MMTPIWATTLKSGAISDGRRKRYVAGEINPRREGPSRIPPTTSPITGGWPARRNNTPKSLPTRTTGGERQKQ